MPEDQFDLESARKIDINAADIGGPSAGLMFSLEIFDQLTEGNLTKGYEIAGTGTIDLQGNVQRVEVCVRKSRLFIKQESIFSFAQRI